MSSKIIFLKAGSGFSAQGYFNEIKKFLVFYAGND